MPLPGYVDVGCHPLRHFLNCTTGLRVPVLLLLSLETTPRDPSWRLNYCFAVFSEWNLSDTVETQGLDKA